MGKSFGNGWGACPEPFSGMLCGVVTSLAGMFYSREGGVKREVNLLSHSQEGEQEMRFVFQLFSRVLKNSQIDLVLEWPNP